MDLLLACLRRSPAAALALLAGLCVLPPLAAQNVDAVAPSEGAYGTQVVITGEDLLGKGKKPAVFLTDENGKKAGKLKVLAADPTTVVAELRKAKAGAYTLTVKPKGKGIEPAVAPAPFEVRVPAELLLESSAASPGFDVGVTGRFFGTKKGKVTVGGKKAKVVAWEPASVPVADGQPLDRAVFRVPKSLWNGQHVVSVASKAGAGLALEPLEVENSAATIKGKSRFEALVDGVPFETKQVSHAMSAGEVQVVATDSTTTVQLRLLYDTSLSPLTLEQQFFEAYVDLTRPHPGTGEAEVFSSSATTVHVQGTQGGKLVGTVHATLTPDDGDADGDAVELVAGVFLSPMTGSLAPLGSTQLVSFTADDTSVDLGQPVTFSWELTGVDPDITTCSIQLYNEDFPPQVELGNCGASGSYEHLFSEGGSYTAQFRVFDGTTFVATQQIAIDVEGMTVNISDPDSGEVYDGELEVRVKVNDAVFEYSVEADVGGLIVPLVLVDNRWEGTVPLEGLPQGDVVVLATATDVFGAQAKDQLTIVYDKKPTLTVGAPTPATVAGPMLHVIAECVDDPPGPCEILVYVDPPSGSSELVLHTESPVDVMLDLSPWEGEQLDVLIQGRDASWKVTQYVDVFVESSPLISPVASGPDELVDAAADRLLFLRGPKVGYALFDLLSEQVTEIPFEPGYELSMWGGSRVFLTGDGAIYLVVDDDYSPYQSNVFLWSDGSQEALTENESGELTYHLKVEGDWAVWDINQQDAVRRHLSTGDQDVVAEAWYEADVAADGTLAVESEADGESEIQLVATDGTVMGITDTPGVFEYSPRTDGSLVAFTRWNGEPAIILVDDGSEEVLREPGPESVGDTHYDVAGGWVAYTDIGSLGQREVWLRDPAGVREKVSGPLAVNADFEALAPDGALTFTAAGRRFLWRNGTLTEVSSDLGRVIVRDGALRLLLGNTVFELP